MGQWRSGARESPQLRKKTARGVYCGERRQGMKDVKVENERWVIETHDIEEEEILEWD
jgi:hypothetical protein